MPGFASKWPVRIERPIGAADVDGEAVSDDAVRRLVDDACTTYLDALDALDRSTVQREIAVDGSRLKGPPASVVVLASVHEVRPTEFVMSLRLYGDGGDAMVRAAALVRLRAPGSGEPVEISRALRDELISFERDAAHAG